MAARENVTFVAKDEAKSSVALAHERLAGAEEAERMQALWRDRIDALKEVKRGGSCAQGA